MSVYKVVCTEQVPVNEPARSAHIVAIGTNTDGGDKASKRWELSDVLEAMTLGDEFYTRSPSTGKTAAVIKFKCPYCARTHIKTTADSIADNNLDNLRFCRFN